MPKGEEQIEARAPGRGGTRMRPALVAAVAVLALGIGIWRGIETRVAAETVLAQATEQAAVPSVEVTHPEAGPPNQEIVLPGNVEAYENTPIYARTNGYLKRWYFDIGAHVKKGDLLAEIETPEIDAQLRQVEADLATAQANLALAETSWNRQEALYKEKWVSGEVRDNAFGAYTADQTIVASKEAQVAQLQRLQSYEAVYAPFDGVITARNTDTGALINAGASGARGLFNLSAIDKVRIFTAVPELYVRAVRIGGDAAVTLDEYPGVLFHGKVVRSTDAIDPVSRTLMVEIDADNADGRLLPGAYAFVHLSLPEDTRTASVTVPAETLIFRKEGLRVGVVRDGKAVLVPIKMGRDYGTRIEVVSGLTPADAVILDPSDSLASGTPVRIASTAVAGSAQ